VVLKLDLLSILRAMKCEEKLLFSTCLSIVVLTIGPINQYIRELSHKVTIINNMFLILKDPFKIGIHI
jgi:hypothetical protein